jgi:hypothetical protein
MRIKELILDNKEPTIYCESFVYEPSNVEEERLGNLFMVGRIRNVTENSFYLVNLLASRVKREYYNLRHISPYKAFEAALKEGNKVLKENEERINWLGNLDFYIATVNEKKIYFTLLGKMKSFILRENEVIDLVQDLIMEKDVLFPFSTILQSNLKKDDILIFSTSNVFSKDILLNKSKEILPINEEKIASIIKPEESGVALVVETGKISDFIERLKPSLDVTKPPVKFTTDIPYKDKIHQGLTKSKGIIQNLHTSAKTFFKPGLKKLKSTVKEKKENVAPRIAIEKMHYTQKLRSNVLDKIKKNKIVLGGMAGAIILGLFIGVVFYKRSAQAKAIDEKIQTVTSLKTQSDNYLVYGDKEKALTNITKGLNLLKTIKNPLNKKTEITKLRKDLNAQIIKLTGRKILDNPQLLFEIKDDGTGIAEKWNPKHILMINSDFYSFSENSPLIHKWEQDSKETFFVKKDKNILGGTMVNKKAVFFLSPSSLLISEFDKVLPVNLPYQKLSLTQMQSYLNFFYVLDKDKGEIIKYSFSQSKIGQPDLWLNIRKSAQGSTSFAIDGSLYLLYGNGKIETFVAGSKKKDFQLSSTYPKIKSVTKIFTSEKNKYFYILEPQTKRIIISNKEGKIISEIESSKFTNMKDVWAGPNDKFAYVLCGNKVYKILINK